MKIFLIIFCGKKCNVKSISFENFQTWIFSFIRNLLVSGFSIRRSWCVLIAFSARSCRNPNTIHKALSLCFILFSMYFKIYFFFDDFLLTCYLFLFVLTPFCTINFEFSKIGILFSKCWNATSLTSNFVTIEIFFRKSQLSWENFNGLHDKLNPSKLWFSAHI